MIAKRLCWSKVEVVVLLLSGSLATLAGSCRVDTDAFQSRVFHCDTAAPDPLCGTDHDGKDMTCFAARQIGGADFCTQKCDAPGPVGADAVCVQGGAQLKYCNPADDADPAGHPRGACDRAEFGCLRTDVTADEGVCVTMNPCLDDTDCHDPVRSTCAATFVQRLYKDNKKLHADHLYCLQEGCDKTNTACSPGETCLRKVIPSAANPPDICVPNCDSNLRCPPNHFCYKKISGPANPAVCIPGLLGFVCETDVDCMVGRCVDDRSARLVSTDDATGLHLCTIDCHKDDDCTPFDSQQGRFVCNSDGHCTTPDAYRGASCDAQDDCVRNPGTVCTRFSSTDIQGTCVYPCHPDGSCPAFGGVNHTCVLGPDQAPEVPVCFPGYFGFPCFDTTTNNSCVGDLSCRGVDLPNMSPGLCTALCASDDDCNLDRWTAGQSYCGAAGGAPFCLPLLADGAACQGARQCQSKVCTMKSGSTAQTCGGQ